MLRPLIAGNGVGFTPSIVPLKLNLMELLLCELQDLQQVNKMQGAQYISRALSAK